jgi:hypothetical protein
MVVLGGRWALPVCYRKAETALRVARARKGGEEKGTGRGKRDVTDIDRLGEHQRNCLDATNRSIH